jgi:hypothetical protein
MKNRAIDCSDLPTTKLCHILSWCSNGCSTVRKLLTCDY